MSNINNTPAWKNETALLTEGGYGTGFWKWSLDIDLEDLQAGKAEDAITVEQHHDTAGMSFAQYHGIVKSYSLPDGVKVSEVETIIADIVARAEELTEGFSVEWDGSNRVGRWVVDATADEFWDSLGETLNDLDCLQSYDLSDSENIPFVRENLSNLGDERYDNAQSADDVEAVLVDAYENDSDWAYAGFNAAAERIRERIKEEREDEASEDQE